MGTRGRMTGHISLRMETIKAQDPNLEVTGMDPAESWNVQLFRTIDSGELSPHIVFRDSA